MTDEDERGGDVARLELAELAGPEPAGQEDCEERPIANALERGRIGSESQSDHLGFGEERRKTTRHESTSWT